MPPLPRVGVHGAAGGAPARSPCRSCASSSATPPTRAPRGLSPFRRMSIRVVLEVAPKRSFASALDWPGWSRGGRNEDEALDALLDYAPALCDGRKRAKIAFTPPATTRGSTWSSDRGRRRNGVRRARASRRASEDEPLSAADLRRLLAFLQAAWTASTGQPGRRRGRADEGSARRRARAAEDHRARAGGRGRLSRPARITSSRGRGRERRQTDGPAAPRLCRGAHRVATGQPLANPRNTRKPWTPRYAVRRSAWHVLDHAWEIEDRSSK